MVCLRAGKLSGTNVKAGTVAYFLSRGYYGILWRENGKLKRSEYGESEDS